MLAALFNYCWSTNTVLSECWNIRFEVAGKLRLLQQSSQVAVCVHKEQSRKWLWKYRRALELWNFE